MSTVRMCRSLTVTVIQDGPSGALRWSVTTDFAGAPDDGMIATGISPSIDAAGADVAAAVVEYLTGVLKARSAT